MLLTIAALQAFATPVCDDRDALTRETWVMSTQLVVQVWADSENASIAAEGVVSEVERFDRLLSTWDASTPMSLLNAAPIGTPLNLPRDLVTVLAEAEHWANRTGGAFEPTLGALVDVWGLRGPSRVPTTEEVQEARAASGPTMFSFDLRRGVAVRRETAAWIDTGAFGKGAALRSVRSLLDDFDVESAIVNLGGQVLVYGTACPHQILVAPPSGQGASAAELELVAASAATSGHSERPGHILDPRSGQQTEPWGSVTVVDQDPFAADVLSTALYVMGPIAGLDWATEAGDIAALFVVQIGDCTTTALTPALERNVTRRTQFGPHKPCRSVRNPHDTLNDQK